MLLRILKITALAVMVTAAAGISAYFTVSLIIKNKDTVVVPDLTGKDVVYVLELLTDLGLNTKVKGSQYSEETAKNHILFQEPQAGSEIKKGRDVNLIISKGPESILMPNLQGFSPRQARLILEENGLVQGNIAYTDHHSWEKDSVIAQRPAPGFNTRRGSSCDLLVSTGAHRKSFKMPDLKGLDLEDALDFIKDTHLTIGTITSTLTDGQAINTVMVQNPSYGYRVTEGDRVNLVINRSPGTENTSAITGAYGIGLFRYTAPNGFLNRHIRIELNCFGFSNTLFDAYVSPGEQIWQLIPRNAGASVLLYEDDVLIRTQVFD